MGGGLNRGLTMFCVFCGFCPVRLGIMGIVFSGLSFGVRLVI